MNPHDDIYIPPKKPKQRRIYIMLVIFNILCYMLLLGRNALAPLLVMGVADPVAAHITAEFYAHVGFFIMLFLPLFISLPFFMYTMIIAPIKDKKNLLRISDEYDEEHRQNQYLEQYKQYAKLKSARWRVHVFYYILFAIQLGLIIEGYFFGHMLRDTQLIRDDYALLQSGDFPVYEGPLLPTDRPRDNNHGFIMIPDENFWYFHTDIGTMRSIRANLLDNELRRPWYRVEYLPGTLTIVSITNAEDILLTGPDGPSFAYLPEGTWLYGDLIVRHKTEVYGYEMLSQAGQRAFDLFYSEDFSRAVMMEEMPTHVFYLYEPIPIAEYRRVLCLYNAATFHLMPRSWRYDTDDPIMRDDRMVHRVYAGGVGIGLGRGQLILRALERAAEIVAVMPSGLSKTEQSYWLVTKVIENVQTDGITMPISRPSWEVWAYSALVHGEFTDRGVASAFAALANEAGIKNIIIDGIDHTGERIWNMVYIDGSWYHIDITWMILHGEYGQNLFIASDDMIAETHMPVSYCACGFIPIPRTQ